jgi:hypothetical protein
VKGEHAVEVAQLEYATDPRLRHNQPHVAVEEAGALQRADDHTEPERVDEIDTGEIDNEPMLALADRRHHELA